jgi:disease resistance protein RPM1
MCIGFGISIHAFFILSDCRYKVDDIVPAKKTTIDSRLIEALYTDATKIVGIEEAKKEVTEKLTEGDGGQQKRIVSIAGFGGLGKTTLAKAVYDEIKGQFDCTAIVSVSRNPDTQKLLKDILYQLDKKTFSDIHSKMLDERLLIDEASEFLKNKRYAHAASLITYMTLSSVLEVFMSRPSVQIGRL